MPSKSLHVAANGKILFYSWVIFHSHTHHVLIIHLSVDGHLGCFHILAIANNASLKFGVHVSFWISGFFQIYIPGVELLGHVVVLFSIFLRKKNAPYCFPQWMPVLIYIPTNSVQGFLFLHILTNIFDNSHSDNNRQ